MDIDTAIKKKVEEYIHAEYEKGYTIDQIYNALLKSGYPDQFCKDLLKKYMNMPKKSSIIMHKSQIIIGLIILAFIVFFVIYIKSFSAADCSSEQCFLEKAQQCKASKYTAENQGIEFRFTTDNQCNFEKEIISLSPGEPNAIQELLQGKSMTCKYQKNNFNEQYLSTLLFGIDKCSGTLKEGLYEIMLANK